MLAHNTNSSVHLSAIFLAWLTRISNKFSKLWSFKCWKKKNERGSMRWVWCINSTANAWFRSDCSVTSAKKKTVWIRLELVCYSCYGRLLFKSLKITMCPDQINFKKIFLLLSSCYRALGSNQRFVWIDSVAAEWSSVIENISLLRYEFEPNDRLIYGMISCFWWDSNMFSEHFLLLLNKSRY